MKYLDETGLKKVIDKIKDNYATKSYVSSQMSNAGKGDMIKATYDADGDGIVDNAKKLEGKSSSDFVLTTDSRLTNARTPVAHTHSATEVTYGDTLSYTVKKNVYINTNGAELSYSGWDDTDFIDVSGHSRIYCNINNQWNCWYKADKTFLAQANFSNKTYLDVPTNAKYLRVSGTASAINSLSISTSAETVASILSNKADKNEIPDVSNFVSNSDSRLSDSRIPKVHLHTKSDIADFAHTHSQYLTEHQSLANYVLTTDPRLSDARTPKSHSHTKSDITDFPEISNGMMPIIIETGKNGTTYASGIWTITSISNWDDVIDGQIFLIPIATSDSSAKKLKIGGVEKSIYRAGTSTVTSHYGVGMIICYYSVTKGALYTCDYDSNTYIYTSTTGASTVAKVIQNPLGSSYNPIVGELFPVYISTTNTANNPTFKSLPIYVEDVKITTTNKGDLLRGSYLGYYAADGLYLTHNGLPKKYLDTLPYLKEHQSLANYVLTTDPRLSDARTPKSHSHIKSDITDFAHTHSEYLTEHQSLANYVQTTDSRLSDARTPKSHSHTKSDITDLPTIPTKTSQLTNDSNFATTTALNNKQDKLTAGANITITNNVISASGGGASYSVLTATEIQNIWRNA